MKWIDAKDELPLPLISLFIKGYHYGKEHKFVGFYNPENKRFYGNGGTYSIKNVKWLKE
jgi:hypothetical protein